MWYLLCLIIKNVPAPVAKQKLSSNRKKPQTGPGIDKWQSFISCYLSGESPESWDRNKVSLLWRCRLWVHCGSCRLPYLSGIARISPLKSKLPIVPGGAGILKLVKRGWEGWYTPNMEEKQTIVKWYGYCKSVEPFIKTVNNINILNILDLEQNAIKSGLWEK